MATKQDKNQDLLTFLTDNFDKLKILLSGQKVEKPLRYQFHGKRGTKTVFMSIKLQYLINEFAIETDTKIGDVIETAMVEYLLHHGYEEKLSKIVKCQNFEGDEGDTSNLQDL